MSYLQIGGERHAIPVGESTIGSDTSALVSLTGDGVQLQHAIVQGLADGQVAIRIADEATTVLVNGVRLGPQPHPLLHGDKVEIAGQELLFVDERRSGSTQYLQAVTPESADDSGARPGRKATTGTGGRLVSLDDGREYVVAGKSIAVGRDASCDVVVTSKNVSRRHAEVMPTPKGYLVIDSSTNGTLVNGQRIDGQQLLARGDVIKCGEYEFRFYADLVPEEPQAELPGIQPAVGEALASLIVRSGELKGQRFSIKVPVVNVGRADYNDICLPEESISTTHAKLQRREGIWVLVDLDSTNGTKVDGEPVAGEVPLAPGALIRFGDVQTIFEPTDDTIDAAKGSTTKVISAAQEVQGVSGPQAATPDVQPVSRPAIAPELPTKPAPGIETIRKREVPQDRGSEGGLPWWLFGLIVVALIAIVLALVGAR
ncbi:MAG: FHA domain-containing protein [Planctomycetota bacterium]|jgi:pSer/pThr/pTyr-binding forkhead associated (FHA) protein